MQVEERIGFFAKIIKSFTSMSFYRYIKSQPFATGFKYLLLFLLIITVALSIRFSFIIVNGTNFIADWISTNIPEITIRNGEVSSPVEQPYKKGTNDFVFILDTTGQTMSISPEYRAGILLLKNKIVHKQSEVETREYDLSRTPYFVLNKTIVDRIKSIFVWITIPLMVVFLYLYYIIAKLFQALLFSLLTLIINAASGLKIAYSGLLNIGVFNLTLPTLLGAIVDITGLRMPFFWLIYTGVYIVYLVIMTIGSKDKAEPELAEIGS
ncbi:MAG: DUF1189 domain-containing protein [Candidatus Omnitrophica bacterium]|nr:DUF1189 domain-containing protein [Candidatus Omnitrophota bacterium]